MKKVKNLLFLALLSLGIVSVNAAEVESNFAITNDYIWRGMTQTDEGFAYSGGVDVSSDNGAYIGLWGSKVDFGPDDDANMEVDVYFGYSDESERGVSFDVGYISYNYPGESGLDFEEIYVGLGYKWVGLTISKGMDKAPDNIEWNVALGDSGIGVTYGDYDGVGKYTLISYELEYQIADKVSIGIGLSDFESEEVDADEDAFVITFSM
tara:strand:+ start:25052 stop:25678 length:627 start_codon:yes stop_codon:yes gene_type:complete